MVQVLIWLNFNPNDVIRLDVCPVSKGLRRYKHTRLPPRAGIDVCVSLQNIRNSIVEQSGKSNRFVLKMRLQRLGLLLKQRLRFVSYLSCLV
jgi:hypothetical protein